MAEVSREVLEEAGVSAKDVKHPASGQPANYRRGRQQVECR